MPEVAARSSRLAWACFDGALGPWMRRRVRVHLAGGRLEVGPGAPLVLVGNHESFWDGFLLRLVQRHLRPHARFHAVMLERELRRRPFLRWLGGLGVTPGSVASGRALLRTLETIRREEPGAVFAYFPQGAICPGSAHPLEFKKGVTHVVRALAPATVLPVGIRLRPGITPAMEAFVSMGPPLTYPGDAPLTAPNLARAVGDELAAIDALVRSKGEGAVAAWPGAGVALPRSPETRARPVATSGWISRN